MRRTVIKGLDDDFRMDIMDVEVIYEVMQRGKAEDAITFSLILNGKELIGFLQKFGKEPLCDVVSDKRYELTAYDW